MWKKNLAPNITEKNNLVQRVSEKKNLDLSVREINILPKTNLPAPIKVKWLSPNFKRQIRSVGLTYLNCICISCPLELFGP